jgi:cell division protease FtsH
VKRIIENGMAKVAKLLEEHRDILTRMSEELLEKETIVLADMERIIEELRPGQYTARIEKDKETRRLAAKRPLKPAMPVGDAVLRDQPATPVPDEPELKKPANDAADDHSQGPGPV